MVRPGKSPPEKLALQPLPIIREFVRAGDRLIGATSEMLEVSLPRLALAPDGRTLLVAYFDDSPDLFRRTWRVFGVDVWAH